MAARVAANLDAARLEGRCREQLDALGTVFSAIEDALAPLRPTGTVADNDNGDDVDDDEDARLVIDDDDGAFSDNQKKKQKLK